MAAQIPPPQAVESAPQSASTAQANAPKPDSGVTSATSFKTLDAFKEKAPALYKKFMQSIQQFVVDDYKRHADRVIQAWKEMRKGNQ